MPPIVRTLKTQAWTASARTSCLEEYRRLVGYSSTSGAGGLSTSQVPASSLQWHEPIEGLEFGETFLGAVASTYFSPGRFPGYGFCFTDRRLIGVKMRLIPRIVEAPVLAIILVLYVIVIFESLSPSQAGLALILLPVLLPVVDWGLRTMVRRLAERILSTRGNDASRILKAGRDFELRKNEIGEFLMKSPAKGLTLGLEKGYFKIYPKSGRPEPIEIKLLGWNQYQKLRDLVISFSSREPRVKALEYPSRL